jgi:hypothetical protein
MVIRIQAELSQNKVGKNRRPLQNPLPQLQGRLPSRSSVFALRQSLLKRVLSVEKVPCLLAEAAARRRQLDM